MLEIEVKVRPHPKTMTVEEFDQAMEANVREFEQAFCARQRERGGDGSPLITPETAVIKAWVYYMATKVEG